MVQTTRREYRQFLNDNFKGLRLRAPLFYSWAFGLRFNLQDDDIDTAEDEYFEEVLRRSSTIFQSAFNGSDSCFVVLMDYKYKRRKIRFSNFAFKQIDKLLKSEIAFADEKRLYYPNDKFDIRKIAIVKLTIDRINFKNILSAIGHSDFPPRQPRLDNIGVFTQKEIYFLNIDKNLIFHMYDDRGLDIISTDKDTLRPIYKMHNEWILDYDRVEIEKQFE